MLMTTMEILAALSALGICLGTGAFESLRWLWILPLGWLGSFLGLVLLLGAFLLIWCALVNMKQPVDRVKAFDRALVEHLCRFIVRIAGIRFRTEGMEKVPRQGRFFLVCNHLHMIDPGFFLAAFRGKELSFISKRENESMPVVGKALHAIGCQSINRENDREALGTILRCIDIIKEDKASIAVFPEGYCSSDGRLQPFRNGVFKIPQRTKVPVVVCVLQSSSHVLKNLLKLRRTTVYLKVLEVIPPEEVTVGTKDLGDRVHSLMAQALGDSIG